MRARWLAMAAFVAAGAASSTLAQGEPLRLGLLTVETGPLAAGGIIELNRGKLLDRIVKVYPHVSQFWTYDPKWFLAQPVYSRDYPPAKNLEP